MKKTCDKALSVIKSQGLPVFLSKLTRKAVCHTVCMFLKLFFIVFHSLKFTHEVRKHSVGFRNAELIIDHGMGGGTSFFMDEYIRKALLSGKNIVLLSNFLHCGEHIAYSVSFIDARERCTFFTHSLSAVLNILDTVSPAGVLCNSIAGIDGGMQILRWLANAGHNVKVSYAVHDFFSICPSLNLIGPNRTFCRMDGCNTCFPALENIVRLPCGTGIHEWRNDWALAFDSAESVICFSLSSRDIILSVYPFLADKIQVRPHSMDYFQVTEPFSVDTEHMRLGVVGNIVTIGKGFDVVSRMASYLADKKEPFFIIGEYSGTVFGEMTVYGKYERNELIGILKKYGVNVVLFPSICPETFSYVISELIAMNIPVLCFDIGAQGEKIRSYDRGILLNNSTPEYIYMEANKLFNITCRKKTNTLF